MSAENNTSVINDFDTRTKVINWIKTTRVQTAMVTALALWIGHITVSPLTVQSAIILGSVGLLVHIWGFTLNEVEDYKYDAQHGEANGHPIAQGKVHAGIARYFAWGAGIIAVAISALSPYPIMATVVLIASFLPGYAYNKWSKQHWWSGGYLSVWASLMVVSGAIHAGVPNYLTTAAAVAVGIQIFVQVLEGDLKDMDGPENTLVSVLGVKVDKMKGTLYDSEMGGLREHNGGSSKCDVIKYTKKFTFGIYFIKGVEIALLTFIVSQTTSLTGDLMLEYLALFMFSAIAFFYTLSLLMVYAHDRDEIKQKSSVHELTSIVVLGVSVMGLHTSGALLIILAPITWYLCVNHTIHSNALNPDI